MNQLGESLPNFIFAVVNAIVSSIIEDCNIKDIKLVIFDFSFIANL